MELSPGSPITAPITHVLDGIRQMVLSIVTMNMQSTDYCKPCKNQQAKPLEGEIIFKIASKMLALGVFRP